MTEINETYQAIIHDAHGGTIEIEMRREGDNLVWVADREITIAQMDVSGVLISEPGWMTVNINDTLTVRNIFDNREVHSNT